MKIAEISPEWVGTTTQIQPQNQFSNWFAQHLETTNTQLINSDKALQSLAKGDAPSLHQVMLSLEEAKISLQLIEQVRSRALTAYQTMMKESV